MSFSHITSQERRYQIKEILEIENDGGFGKYLGLFEQFSRRKRDLFANIIDRINHKSNSWSTRFPARAGKMIMLRTVLSTMSSYSMSCFKLPQFLCAQI